jgi:glycosyltransferase involved in cell wall biosynthesis
VFRSRIEQLVEGVKNPPSIYLLFGDLTDSEMNGLYNHPKIKSMISITKGEGFGRPLLEFSMTGKPIIASNWSGHKDFLPMDKAIMIGGKLTEVHDSVIDNFIIKGSKWFTANYNEASEVMKLVILDYEKFSQKSEQLRLNNLENFTKEKMKDKFIGLLSPYMNKPKEHKPMLPKLNKIS